MKDGDKDGLVSAMQAEARDFYQEREALLTGLGVDMREFERVMLLSAVDNRWMDHIDAMDQLRDGIGYRAMPRRTPWWNTRLNPRTCLTS